MTIQQQLQALAYQEGLSCDTDGLRLAELALKLGAYSWRPIDTAPRSMFAETMDYVYLANIGEDGTLYGISIGCFWGADLENPESAGCWYSRTEKPISNPTHWLPAVDTRLDRGEHLHNLVLSSRDLAEGYMEGMRKAARARIAAVAAWLLLAGFSAPAIYRALAGQV